MATVIPVHIMDFLQMLNAIVVKWIFKLLNTSQAKSSIAAGEKLTFIKQKKSFKVEGASSL